MRRNFAFHLCVFILLINSAQGQSISSKFINPTRFTLDSLKVQRILAPYEKTNNVMRVVRVLKDSCNNDLEKVYGIYTYIASSFTYDLNRLALIQKNQIKRELYAKELMRKKRGVCGDFATLFKSMSDSLRIPAMRVDGYAQTGRLFHPVRASRMNHAWNVVKIGEQWYPVDVTYGVRQFTNKKFNRPFVLYAFLLQQRKLFSLLHLPADPDFQFYDNKISFKDFKQMNWLKKAVSFDTLQVNKVMNARYAMSIGQNVLQTARNAQDFLPRVKAVTLRANVVVLTKVIDRKTKKKEKITAADIELAKEIYKGLIDVNAQKRGRKYKLVIRYCNAELEKIDKLERKLFPKNFK